MTMQSDNKRPSPALTGYAFFSLIAGGVAVWLSPAPVVKCSNRMMNWFGLKRSFVGTRTRTIRPWSPT